MKIYLIRHGQTDWNIEGRIQGSHDIPLNETGRLQAARLAEGMDSRPVAKIFTSPQRRAAETAATIGERQQAEVYAVHGLEEVDFGDWEGMTWEEIREKYPREYERWSANPVEVAPPGGESQMDSFTRSARAMETILSMTDEKSDIAVVSHGALLAYIVAYLLRDHPEESDIIVDNASITTINYNPLTEDYMLLDSNDVSHLKNLQLTDGQGVLDENGS